MDLNFRKYGEGPPLIILHGLFGSSDNWHAMARCWSQHFTVFAVDQRNHGASPHTTGINYNLLSGDLQGFMDEQQIESAFLVGHSMGGKVAMLFADQFPERVRGLVILDIGIKAYEPRHEAILEVLRDLGPETFDHRNELEPVLAKSIASPGVRQFLIKNLKRDTSGKLAWKFNRQAILADYPKLVAEIPMQVPCDLPALFIRGANSDYITNGDWPVLQNFFPRGELTTLEDAGHWLHAEKPNEICDLVHQTLVHWLAA